MRNSLKKHLLVFSLCCSLCLHLATLFFLQRQSLWFKGASRIESKTLLAEAKSTVLKQAFQSLTKVPSKVQPIEQQETLFSRIPSTPVDLSPSDLFAFQPELPFSASELLASNAPFPAAFKPLAFPLELFSQQLATYPAPTLVRASPPKHPEELLLEPTSFPDAPLHQQFIAFEAGDTKLELPPLADPLAKSKAALSFPTPPGPAFPTLSELSTTSYSDSFDIEVTLEQEDDGVIFALTLIPHQDLKLPSIRQHYSFLIDRSNSIQRERLIASKEAVFRALDKLEPNYTFNIIVFDSTLEKLFPTGRSPNLASLSAAKAFLNKINLGSFFSSAELYNPLLLTLPEKVEEDAAHIAVLITDGEQLSKKSGMRTILQNWTYQNGGKVALYTVGMSCDAQLACLDVASAFNKGRLFFASTNRGIRRKLLKLMNTVHTPIAKNLVCQAISKSPMSKVFIMPHINQLPNLYLGQPFTILGKSETLDDFILFVQGRLKEGWINIRKKISFIDAKKGGSHLKQEWALAQAYRCYERYLYDDNPEHLEEAKTLLYPFELQPAFQ